MKFYLKYYPKRILAAFIVACILLVPISQFAPLFTSFADNEQMVSETEVAEVAENEIQPSEESVANDEIVEAEPTESTEAIENESLAEETEASDEVADLPEETVPVEETESIAPSEEIDTTTEEEVAEIVNIDAASSADDYINKVAGFNGTDTLIISTTDEIASISADAAVYYEGAYVLSFSDSQACTDAITFASEAGYEYTTDEIFAICGNEVLFENEPLSANGTVKVAVIDTGSNNANEVVSVIGDNGSDANGHGTNMCNYILANCSEDVYLLSIKAIGDNGTGSATDVYTAIQYAMEKDCDVILLAVSMKDTSANSALNSLIGEAVSSGIAVIAAAGNGDQNAESFTPANIPGVITVGAIDSNGYKQSSSNYGSCVDYYVEASSTSSAAALFTGSYLSGNTDNIATSYLTEEQTTVVEPSEEGELNITITPIYSTGYDENGFQTNATTVTGNHVQVVWNFGTQYWSSVERSSYRSSINNDLSGINGISNIDIDFKPWDNYSSSQGGYRVTQCIVEFDVESIQDIVGGGSFYNAVTSLNAMGDKSYAGGIVIIAWDDVATAINNNELSSANSSGYTVQTQNGWVRRICHGPYTRPNIGSLTYCSEPGVAFNDNYTVTVYGNDTSGDVPVAALNGYMAEAAARVFASSQSEQAKQGFVWACKGLNVATAVATDPGADAFPITQYDGGTVSLNMTTTSTLVNGELFAVPGQTYTFTDTNGQIGNYTASSSYSGVTATISGNDLVISVASNADPAQIKNTTISLECNSGYDGPVEVIWHVYAYSSDGQDQINGDYKRQQPHYNATPWSIGLVSEVYVDIVKTSSNTAIVANNNCYSLAGTTYGLYTSGGTLVHTFTLDATGNTSSYTITDLTQSYYVKEISAGPGYYLDTATYNVNFADADANQTITFSFSDVPMSDPLNWSLVKVDQTGWDSVTGLTLAGTTFNVSYYDTTNVNSLADALALTTPFESVNLTTATDASGASKITVSSSNLAALSSYFASFGTLNTLPLGTYVIKEVSAPTGYNSIPTNAAYVIVLFEDANGQPDMRRYSTGSYFYTLTDEMAQVYEPPKLGYAKFFKESTVNTNLATAAPTLYDLAGTKYEIYYTNSDKLACTITFETSGKMSAVSFPSGVNGVFDYNAQTIQLPAGTYYAKEVQTGKGYYLNSGTQSFTVTEGNTTSVTFDDEPMYADFELVLEKLVTATGISQEAADLYSVEGAVFCVNYYNEIVPETNLSSVTPTKSWFFETDADGKIFYKSDYLTSTSYYLDQQGIITLFKDANGKYVAPQGTYTITEISAPTGLAVNTTTYVRYLVLGSNIVKGSPEDPANNDAWTLTVDGNVIVPETPFVPTIDTVAMASDGSKELAAAPNQTITDSVTVLNLVSGYEYKLKGELFLTDGTSLGITKEQSVTFTTAGASGGTFDMDFTFDATGLEGKTIVVVESLYVIDKNGKEILFVSHDDLTDTDQQVTIPDIETTLLDSAIDTWDPTTTFGSTYTNSLNYTKHISYGTKVTLTDYVLYTNLVVGYTYTVSGTLKNADTGEDILDNAGNPITGSTTFTATQSEGCVEVLFNNVDTTALSGVTTVAFEDLTRNGINIVSHEDLTDTAQSVPPPPELQTTATEESTGTKVLPYSEKVTIVDTVEYSGLVVGKTYTVSGNLYNADTGAILLDEKGNAITASTTFTASAASGAAEVVFSDVYVPLSVEKVVVFENLYYNGVRIAIHADLSDENQTVRRPSASTLAQTETGEKTVVIGVTATIVDTISYKGLEVGKEYKAVGTLYKKDGTQVLNSDGTPVTASKTFKPTSSDGTTSVTLTFDTLNFTENDVVVVFETIYDVAESSEKSSGTQTSDIIVAKHEDLNDTDQSITFAPPEIKTNASEHGTGSQVLSYSETVTIDDLVSYSGLVVGKTYTVSGNLYNADTGAILYGEDGKVITASTTFTATASSGSVLVTFKDVYVPFTVEKVVVFENLYYNNVRIAIHADLSDENQTVRRATASTLAQSDIGKKTVVIGIDATIVDTISYKGLEVGKEYKAVGTLYKKDGTQVLNSDGTPVTASTTFKPDTADGTVTVNLTFNTTGYTEADSVVVFETIYDVAEEAEKTGGIQTEDIVIAKHEDLNDADQTIGFVLPPVPATGEFITISTIVGIALITVDGALITMHFKKKKKA